MPWFVVCRSLPGLETSILKPEPKLSCGIKTFRDMAFLALSFLSQTCYRHVFLSSQVEASQSRSNLHGEQSLEGAEIEILFIYTN